MITVVFPYHCSYYHLQQDYPSALLGRVVGSCVSLSWQNSNAQMVKWSNAQTLKWSSSIIWHFCHLFLHILHSWLENTYYLPSLPLLFKIVQMSIGDKLSPSSPLNLQLFMFFHLFGFLACIPGRGTWEAWGAGNLWREWWQQLLRCFCWCWCWCLNI